MKSKKPVLLIVEEHGIPKRHALQLIKQLAERFDTELHLYMCAYRRGYEKPIEPDSRHTRREAHHVADARHRLEELRETLNSDFPISGETLNWKHPSSEALPPLISELAPQCIVVVRLTRNLFKRIAPSRKHWDIVSTCGVPVVFTDPDFRVTLSRDVWAAVDIPGKNKSDNGLNDQIITQAQLLADKFGGDVHLVHCHHTGYQLTQYVLSLSQSDYVADPRELRQSRDEHQKALEIIAAKYDIPAPRIHNLPGVAKVIVPILASKKRPLFVVAGAAQKSPVKKWFVGSTSKTLMKRLTTPLCLVYESAASSDDEERSEPDPSDS